MRKIQEVTALSRIWMMPQEVSQMERKNFFYSSTSRKKKLQLSNEWKRRQVSFFFSSLCLPSSALDSDTEISSACDIRLKKRLKNAKEKSGMLPVNISGFMRNVMKSPPS